MALEGQGHRLLEGRHAARPVVFGVCSDITLQVLSYLRRRPQWAREDVTIGESVRTEAGAFFDDADRTVVPMAINTLERRSAGRLIKGASR